MARLTDPLREEHQELRPQLEALRAAAEQVGSAPRTALAKTVSDCHSFLAGHLLVHAQAEEAALYPAVEQAMGCAGATDTMKLDHAEVRRLTERLADLRDRLSTGELAQDEASELKMVLYGLYVLVNLHLQKEEEAYLPALDARLTPEQAAGMFARLHAAAEAARSGAA